MKILAKVPDIFDRINDLLSKMVAGIIGLLMLSICYAVVTRYFFNFSTWGMFELWEYSLLYIPFLGAAWLLSKDGHVSIDIIPNRLKPRPRAILNITTSILGALACLAITWGGTQATLRSFQQGLRLPGELYFPQGVVLMIIPIGCLLLFVQFLRRANNYMKDLKMSTNTE